MAAKKKRRRGRPEIIEPLAGKHLTYRQLAARYPGTTRDEWREARRSINGIPLETPTRRWKTTLVSRTAYDKALLAALARSAGLGTSDFVAEAVRAWLRERGREGA